MKEKKELIQSDLPFFCSPFSREQDLRGRTGGTREGRDSVCLAAPHYTLCCPRQLAVGSRVINYELESLCQVSPQVMALTGKKTSLAADKKKRGKGE